MISATEARDLAVGKNSDTMQKIGANIRRLAKQGKTQMYCHANGDKNVIAEELKRYGFITSVNKKSITVKW